MDIDTKHLRSKSKLMILELGLENSKLKLQIAQQEKLAELGKLALTTQPCYYEYQHNDGDCHMERCSSCELCRIRAEMLRGKV